MATPIQLTLDFSSIDADSERLERLTQALWQELRDMDDVVVARLEDPNPPIGAEGANKLPGWLTAEIKPVVLLNAIRYLHDRLGRKPIKVTEKIGGNERTIEVTGQADLAAVQPLLTNPQQPIKIKLKRTATDFELEIEAIGQQDLKAATDAVEDILNP